MILVIVMIIITIIMHSLTVAVRPPRRRGRGITHMIIWGLGYNFTTYTFNHNKHCSWFRLCNTQHLKQPRNKQLQLNTPLTRCFV